MKNEIHVSPAGIAVYPRLNKPDTKFDPDGVYSVKLSMSKADVAKINKVIKPLMEGGKNNPIKPEKDDQGEPTGNYQVAFKMKAHVKTKGGDSWDQKPIIMDSNGMRTEVNIGGGSKIQVAYEAIPYTAMGGGVSLRLKKVRVLDLVEYAPKDDVEWGEEKGSFQAPEKPAGNDDDDFDF